MFKIEIHNILFGIHIINTKFKIVQYRYAFQVLLKIFKENENTLKSLSDYFYFFFFGSLLEGTCLSNISKRN